MPKDNTLETANALTTPAFILSLPETGDPLDVAGKIYRDIHGVNESMTQAVYSIDADGHLSDDGKAAKRAEVAKAKRHELRKAEAELSGLVEHTIQKAKAARKRETPLSDSAQQLRNQEIRGYIAERVKGQDNLGMTVVINKAIETNDFETLDAILSAPPAWEPGDLIDDIPGLESARFEMEKSKLGIDAVALIQADKELKSTIAAVDLNLAVIADDAPDEIKELAHGDSNAA
jgi:hypothetical protein